jgi:hypothetical protein
MKTRVVHVNDNVPGAVYIGRANGRKGLRASPWANPYTIGDHRTVNGTTYLATRANVIEWYRRGIAASVRTQEWETRLSALAGKPLACWCRHDGEERTPDNACHGDVLCDLIRELGLEAQP